MLSCGVLALHKQFPIVLDISSSRVLHFLTILTVVGGEYRLKEDHSATTTKKQILIHFIKHYFTTALRNIIYLLLSRDFLIRCDMSDLFQDTL